MLIKMQCHTQITHNKKPRSEFGSWFLSWQGSNEEHALWRGEQYSIQGHQLTFIQFASQRIELQAVNHQIGLSHQQLRLTLRLRRVRVEDIQRATLPVLAPKLGGFHPRQVGLHRLA